MRGLQQVSWLKVDVSFHSALWPFLAHNSITVSSLSSYIQLIANKDIMFFSKSFSKI